MYTYFVLTSMNLICSCFVHVQQHAPPHIAGAGHPCHDRSLFLFGLKFPWYAMYQLSRDGFDWIIRKVILEVRNSGLANFLIIISRRAEGLRWEILQRPRPSVCLSVHQSGTFSFRTITRKRIDIFSRNFAGMCTMPLGCAVYFFDIDGMLFECFNISWGGGGVTFFFFFRKTLFSHFISRFFAIFNITKNGNIEKCPFSYWLNGRWFLQIIDRDSGNLYPI